MLVITRKQGESIVVDDRIVFTIVEARQVNGEIKVRVGIEAPREFPVHRREVLDAIKHESERAD